ncbi:MAG: amino acid adenylation domain-containing protein [Verrucomicrobiota bacterium]
MRAEFPLPRPSAADLISVHYDLQRGLFLSEVEAQQDWVRVSSDVSALPMWNHLGCLRPGVGEPPARIVERWQEAMPPSRRPAVYFVEPPPPTKAAPWSSKEFERCDQESWMVYARGGLPQNGGAETLQVRLVASELESSDFIGVFCAAYRAAPEVYGPILRRKEEIGSRRDVANYVAYAEGKPVCVATLLTLEWYSGIYNVGTLPSARRQGYAAQLLIHLIREARSAGRFLFLQTESGSGAERLYCRLGFETVFARTGYRLIGWQQPARVPSRKVRSQDREGPSRTDALLPTSSVEAERTLPLAQSEGVNLVPWSDACISRLFEEQVAKTPTFPAVILGAETPDPKQTLTYAELNRRANCIAHSLRERRIGPEAVVGLCVERSADLIVALLGIFKAGAVCLPMDPVDPEERLRFILEDARPELVLTSRSTRVPIESTRLLLLEDHAREMPSRAGENWEGSATAAQAAYIIYTSGSSGKPKGVVIQHGAFANHCLESRAYYALTEADRVLQFNSVSFDAALEQICPPLIAGAAIVLRGPEVWTGGELSRRIERHGLTVVDLPTAYWHQLLELWHRERATIPSCLPRLLIVGGEAMRLESLELWQQLAFAKVRLINAYGPTEATITSTAFEATPEFLAGQLPPQVPIGQVRGRRTVCVLDHQGRPLRVGATGELYIGGPLLARGYLNRPELTAQKFVADSTAPGRRFYRTGDLVRMRADGLLEFLGRTDRQVKVRGYRVELEEVEAVLGAHPQVSRSAVVLRQEAGHGMLVAFYLRRGETTPTALGLRLFLRNRLAEHMVPARLVCLERLPLLPSGKVDYQALLQYPLGEAEPSAAGVRNPTELQLQLLFERILNRRGVGVDDSFFELGGDSLQALELIIEMERLSGRSLPLETLYQKPTIESLAQVVLSQVSVGQGPSLVPLQTRGIRPPLFLIHTTPGDILGYGNLVYHFGREQPCYGIQSVGLSQPELGHRRIEDMAVAYVKMIRSIAPEGPYFLAGWCYGGIVAVEMAQHLLALGERVGLLGLLETVAPRPAWTCYRYFIQRTFCLLRMPPSRWLDYLRHKVRYHQRSYWANRMRFRRLEKADADGSSAVDEQNRTLARLEHVYKTNLHALRQYRPRPYPGRVTLFNAEQVDPGVIPDESNAWVGLAREIEVHQVPGDHDTMLIEPNVAELARIIQSCLRRAQEQATGSDRAAAGEDRPLLSTAASASL